MLARQLGRTLGELGETMSYAEFIDHYEDWCREPWGERRMDWHFARLNQTVMNSAGKTFQNIDNTANLLLKFKDPNEPEPEPDPATFFKQFK